ncbi:hypothetical protein VNO78_19610 [Psophocarpus tetragonolobus]|uniref:F-box domain-containing protein n=1 Tax=Psophocarpus tetragonolobus TaxID=3891 RepID=A0AAN9S7T9_PSOTE
MQEMRKVVFPLSRLPEELVLEILLRLPVRSLLQFRSVCKLWKTLIDNPQFAKVHLRTSASHGSTAHLQLASPIVEDSKILSYSVESVFQNPSLPVEGHSYTMDAKYTILGSCNGLLCLSDLYKRHVILLNPSTRLQSQRFPISVLPQPSLSHYGFGYDHVNDKYKLLVADFTQTVTKIYTFGSSSNSNSNSNCCRVIQNFPCHLTKRAGKFVSGTLNWMAKREEHGCERRMILSFDLGKETYGEVLLPEGERDRICSPLLDVLHCCLCVCFSDCKKGHWVVWLMKEYGVHHSWTKLMVIPYINHGIIRWSYMFAPLCISENSVLLLKTKSSRLALYHFNHDRMNYLRIVGPLGFDFHLYHQSLISPLF